MEGVINMANISSDIYGLSEYVNEIKKQYINVSEDTLQMGMFGYLGEVFSNILQNSVIMASEYSNEGIPVKAKFEKNIITHALSLEVGNINATPASMSVLLGFLESDVLKNMTFDEAGYGTFKFDKNTPMYIGDFEFHTDYDIVLNRKEISNGTHAYTATYNIDRINPLSDVSNPYMSPPNVMRENNNTFIFIQCRIRQVEHQEIYRKVMTDNTVENKTFNFDFDSQLASFDIVVREGNEDIYLVPVYDGLYSNTLEKTCYYSYLDSRTIRIKFNRDSYEPRINADITVNLKTTQGADGNFTYKQPVYINISSEKYGYSNMSMMLRPVSDSEYGTSKKTIDEIKKIIPKEALSRGAITNTTDLNNFFNMIDTDMVKLYFFKKRDNQLERLYYSYLLLKDSNNVVVPTNTINLKVQTDKLIGDDKKNILNHGNIIYYDPSTDCGISVNDESNIPENAGFVYSSPFMIIINDKPISASYYLNIINMTKYFGFNYINQNSYLQFISTSGNWVRSYKEQQYTLDMSILQNINSDEGMVTVDENGNITTNIRLFAVLYSEDGKTAYRYTEAEMIGYDNISYISEFRFTIKTDDSIDTDGRIKLIDLLEAGKSDSSNIFVNSNTPISIFVVYKKDGIPSEDTPEFDELKNIVPNLDGYILSNIYSVTGGLDFFFNYSNIISSNVKPYSENGENGYILYNVPLVKYSYLNDITKIDDFIYQIDRRKEYIDYCLSILEDSFGVDFKFFNTYGPSKLFKIEDGATDTLELIDRVNLSMRFKAKTVANSDKYIKDLIIKDIKLYMEDIGEISDLHIPNLITEITTKYRDQLVYFEFLGMNDNYKPQHQHVYNSENNIGIVPEFLNIDTKDNGNPDIEILLV